MSRENVERWRRGADAWSRGDLEAWLEDIPADWEWRASGVFPGLPPVFRGLEGARELWDGMRGPWQEFEIEVVRLEDLGDKLLALVTFDVRGRDGLATSRQWGYVVTFRNDGGVRTDNYSTWDEALDAVGLSE
jgi:ketosteroid isomerase-like protein